MSAPHARQVEYDAGSTRLVGQLYGGSAGAPHAPAVVLLPDAFGVSAEMRTVAERLAALGGPVLLADLWGEGRTPSSEPEIGPLIGGLVGDHETWMARVEAALRTATDQPELADRPLVLVGYCFGGSSALELLRTGGTAAGPVAGVVAVHPGLDLLRDDWSAAGSARVLVCVGAADPMATTDQRRALERSMSGVGLDWQTHLYSDTKHAFTSPLAAHSPMPDVVAYHPRNAARAWAATTGFLGEIADLAPTH